MTPSARTPGIRQTQALYRVSVAEGEPVLTDIVHRFRANGLVKSGKPEEKQRATYELLGACHRYEWLERVVLDEDARKASPNDGSGIAWVMTAAGTEALDRGRAAIHDTKGETVESTTMDPTTEDPDLKELDNEDEHTEDGGPVDVEDAGNDAPRETRHTTEGEQLTFTLNIGGAKPTTSTITVNAKQVTYKDREFEKGDVLSFSGELRIVEVGARDKKQGTQRFHKAVVDHLEIEGDE